MTNTSSLSQLEIGTLVTVARYPGVIYKIASLYQRDKSPQALILYVSGDVGIHPMHKDLATDWLRPV